VTAPSPIEMPSSTATAGLSTPPTSAPTDYRVPETHPNPLFRGKTYAEILSIGDQLSGAVVQQHQQLQDYQARAYQPPPPQAPAFDPTTVRDDDYVDGRTLKNYLAQVAGPVQQGFQSVYGNLAQHALSQVKAKYPDAFQRYGQEIDNLARNIPVEGRNLDNLSAAVELVLGRHVKDEATRLAQELAAQQDPTLRGGTMSSTGPGLSVGASWRDELPSGYRAILDQKGINDETIREFFRTNSMTPEQQKDWFDRAKKHNSAVITERSVRGG
jgi:hypothetical protein